jgi:hypothetical protein
VIPSKSLFAHGCPRSPSEATWTRRLAIAACSTMAGWMFCQANAQQPSIAPVQMPVPVQTPAPGANTFAQPSFQPAPINAQPQPAMPSPTPSRAPTLAEQMVNTPPPAPAVVIQPAPVVVPPGVVYVAPAYAAPGIGWVWDYHPRYGWGWRHPEHGWHRRW